MPASHVDKVHEAVSKVMGSDGNDATTDMVLLVACGCMAVSTLAFWGKAKESTKRFNYVAMAVTGIATMAYLAMWSGAGITQVDGRDVYWMRYVDWFFTTPFFLLDLALLANADMWDTFFVMLLNAICILCGAIGALQPSARLSMFILGMVTFVGFNAKLFGSMMANAAALGADVSGKYKAVTTLTMGIWCAYPVMYLLCEVTGALGVGAEVFLYAILDVVAKCVCSFILLGSDDILLQVNKQAPGYQSLLGQ
jgi:bacteriorhodopsin